MNYDLFEGPQLRDRGITQVYNNNRVFVEQMRDLARDISLSEGIVSADDLRFIAEELGIAPASPNAWGAIFKEPGWVSYGHIKSEYKTNHARYIQVWTWKPAA